MTIPTPSPAPASGAETPTLADLAQHRTWCDYRSAIHGSAGLPCSCGAVAAAKYDRIGDAIPPSSRAGRSETTYCAGCSATFATLEKFWSHAALTGHKFKFSVPESPRAHQPGAAT